MDHREVGLHHKVRGSADHSAVTVWQKERELDNLPDSPLDNLPGNLTRLLPGSLPD